MPIGVVINRSPNASNAVDDVISQARRVRKLGLGLGAKAIEAQMFGTTWSNPVGGLREHLQMLRSIFDTGAPDFDGTELSASDESGRPSTPLGDRRLDLRRSPVRP